MCLHSTPIFKQLFRLVSNLYKHFVLDPLSFQSSFISLLPVWLIAFLASAQPSFHTASLHCCFLSLVRFCSVPFFCGCSRFSVWDMNDSCLFLQFELNHLGYYMGDVLLCIYSFSIKVFTMHIVSCSPFILRMR